MPGDVSGAQGDVKYLSDVNDIGDIPRKESINLTHEEKTGRPLGCVFNCLLYTSPSPRDMLRSRMPSSA